MLSGLLLIVLGLVIYLQPRIVVAMAAGIAFLAFRQRRDLGDAEGIETTSVLEPSTLVAIVVYVILAWGIVKLVRILSGEKQAS